MFVVTKLVIGGFRKPHEGFESINKSKFIHEFPNKVENEIKSTLICTIFSFKVDAIYSHRKPVFLLCVWNTSVPDLILFPLLNKKVLAAQTHHTRTFLYTITS